MLHAPRIFGKSHLCNLYNPYKITIQFKLKLHSTHKSFGRFMRIARYILLHDIIIGHTFLFRHIFLQLAEAIGGAEIDHAERTIVI